MNLLRYIKNYLIFYNMEKISNFINFATFIGILLIIGIKLYLHDDVFGWVIAASLSLYIIIKKY